MGLLVNGNWQDKWYDTKSSGGKFIRSTSQFRNFISKQGDFKPETNRYHLYVSYACPWAHRSLIYRSLKKLESHISISVVNPYMLENGWTFDDYPGVIIDSLYNSKYLYQIYLKANPVYTGRVTVPILWDKKMETIVSNESSEIIRMLNSEFNDLTGDTNNFYPSDKQKEIDEINDYIYERINNGVYKTGFATSQDVYEDEVNKLFEGLDFIENLLNQNQYYSD